MSQPEHITSELLKRDLPEEMKLVVNPVVWDTLVEKYGEEKVKRYYRLQKEVPTHAR